MPIPKLVKPSFGQIASVAYRQHPRYRGMVGHWIMAEGGGTKVRDISGFGNDGTMTNMEPGTDWVIGQFGRALDFDGVDDYVALAGFTATYAAYTISAWIAPNSVGEGNFGTILSKETTTNNFHFRFTVGNNLRFFAKWTGTDGEWGTPIPSLTPDGSWHHVVLTYKAVAGKTPNIYIDGIDQSLTQTSGPTTGSEDFSSNPYIIGNRSNETRTFDGLIDDVYVFNRVFNTAEIWSLYTDPFLEFDRRPFTVMPIAAAGGRIMSSLARHGGLASPGGIAGQGGGLAG